MSEKGEFKEAVKAFAGLQIAHDSELQSTENIGRVSLDIESTTFDGGISRFPENHGAQR